MSSRWYPIYSRGNPQLRIFLPNLWMKLVKNENVNLPPNRVTFHVSPQMTRLDVKNYLEKIYNLPVLNVKTVNITGKTFRSPYGKGSEDLFKEDDIKVAFVTFPKHIKAEYPDVTVGDDDAKATLKKTDEQVNEMKLKYLHETGLSGGRRQGAPSFFGL